MQKSYRTRSREHDELLTDLMLARGIEGTEAQENFLSPSFERDSHDPFLLPDMGVAVERILAAVKNNELVCVWSDYDCDGIPGGVMLSQFLRELGLKVIHYIPHRHKEGYGLNEEGIEELATQQVKLIITIDLGTTEHTSIAYAKQKGIDTIVTDHHVVQDLPPALAVLNPKRTDSKYPFDGLCGAGVAWKLVQAILVKHRPEGFAEGKEKWLLDLVGIATLSDMVPLVGENRMLAHFGLKVLRRNRRKGIASLLSLLRINPHTLTEDDIGFMVSPRINAASRMEHPETAAKLLASESVEEAGGLARELNRINDERKGVVASIVKDANHRLKENPVEGPVIVMGSIKWRPGVLGLVANKLMEAHQKPVFLWGREGGEVIKGSCRSDNGVSVVNLMGAARDVFIEFGGHHASGGFSLLEERVHELAGRLTAAYETMRASAEAPAEVWIERELSLSEVSFASRDLMRLAPFGEGNRKPLFLFPHVSVTETRAFGKTGDHLEAMIGDGFDAPLSAVSFFSNPDSFGKPLTAGSRADIVGHVERDWRGKPRVRIVDVI
ncbi:MAG: single-stranded-DNA-specific exonuclease RecJ [Patescibacteria group bacterium]|nr:single-stranded-DNA-specific exonuclease RecJ [Patescibacteria group bacterium]